MTDETTRPEPPIEEESTTAQAEAVSEPMPEPEPQPEVESKPEPVAAEAESDAAPMPEAEPVATEAESDAAPMPQAEPEPIAVAAESDALPTPEPEQEPIAVEAATPAAEAGDVAEAQPEAAPEVVAAEPVAATEPSTPMTMAELLDDPDNEVKSLKHGDVVEGTVVRIDPDEILVDFGGKSEGVVSNRELMSRRGPRDGGDESRPELKVGDEVLVYVLQPESPEGHAVLSLRRAGLERKWRAMQERFDAGEIVEAKVIDHNKGGLIVDLGVRGFVPISQIVDFPRRPRDEQPRDAAQEIAEKLQPFVGRTLRLKILEVNRKANRLILSEKVALYEERREKRDELFSSLQVGQRVTGVVRSIAPFGVFIDLGGIDGLVHKSELSWNKVNNPETAYAIGEEVEAEVIDINHERGRISLSIRRLQPDPWQESVAKYTIGDVISGTVTKLVNFGAFVRVEEGLEGLIHISELSNQRVAHPGDVVKEGEEMKLKIISLDSERHRLGLSLKQAEDRPVAATSAPTAPAAAAPRFEDRPAPRQRDRRDRRDRDYRPEDAISEPDEGIDSTMAAAFAESGLLAQFRTSRSRGAAETQDDARDADADTEGAEAESTVEPVADAATEPEADTEAPAEEAPSEEAPAAEAPAEEVDAAAEPEPAVETEVAAEVEPQPAEEPEAVPIAEASTETEPTAEAEPASEDEPEPAEAKAPAKAGQKAKA